jgi:predicted nucleic acid-binding protein
VRRVFVDTSAFVALRNRSEHEHGVARTTLQKLVAVRAKLFTSNYVFSETYTALLVRVGRHEAIEWGRRFRASAAIELLRVEDDVDEAAWSILDGRTDKTCSHVDATSFALMEQHELTEAFAFDHHFTQHGLTIVPSETAQP